ncbi:MAG: UDP-3-O-(3-hydroxymyristoyl)glucosamine N-acyltransferase [Elusimicrobia bacterium]|nr:UDP-3-O-(3-hydroxymyristoyl)glucosamine N-acyltransferase [Elusimicrobiota bacterium]
MKVTLEELAKLTGGTLEGDGRCVVEGAAGLSEAGPKDVSFLENPKYAAQVETTRAACVFLPESARAKLKAGSANRIYSGDPRWAFAQVLALLEKTVNPHPAPGVSPKADVHAEAVLGKDVSVGAFAVVEQASIGDGTAVGAQCYIGSGARVGKGCRIYPQVVIREHCVVGDRVIIHSGTVVGSDGYGFATDLKTGTHRKVPQIGNVVIEDDVEIGANVTLDRATTGSTVIGAGTKIDNLVQFGHNVQVGRHCLIVSQVGISGSTKVGNHVVIAGQAGLVGHIKIGDGAVVTAQTGVMNDVEPKAVVFGSPALPHREALKLHALYKRLPDVFETLKEVKQKLSKSLEETHVG